MKKSIKTIFAILFIIITFNSCDDFLDVKPIGIVNSETFYSTKADAEVAVTAVYGILNYMQVWDMFLLADLGSVASDHAEAGGNNFEDVPAWQEIDKFTFTPALPSAFACEYGALYKMIMLANIALEKLPAIPEKDTTVTEAFINQRLAEVKFLRALDYFYLVQVYGEVPFSDHILGSSEYLTVKRSALRGVFDLMESDLEDAVTKLPATYPESDKGRVTKGAAQALLAKVYLLESSYAHYYPNDNYSLVNSGESRFKDLIPKWDKALAMAENVISSGNYKLVGIDGEKYETWRGPNTDGFRYIWTSDGNNSQESVFEIQCEYLGLGWLRTRGSSMVWWTSARWIFDPVTNNPVESKYWGFNVPSQSLKEEFNKEKRQPGDPYYASLTPADPRFNTTIHMDTIGGNDSINLTGSGVWARICYEFTPTQLNKTRMFQAKYECSYDEFIGAGAGWSEAPFNNRLIRYADVVLVAAEAAIMSGNNAKALEYINLVRTRARMCGPVGNTVPADYPAGTNVTMEMLMHERSLELALEGHRFFDLVRWNQATNYINGQYLQNSDVTVTFISPKNDFFPMPEAEVNTSGGGLLQYEGW